MRIANAERIFILALMGLLAAFMVGSLGHAVELRVMPLLFGGVGIAFLAVALFRDRLSALAAWSERSLTEDLLSLEVAPEMPDRKVWVKSSAAPVGGAIRTVLYMVAFWIAFVIFGMTASIPVFMAVFLIAEAKLRPARAIGISATTCLVIVVILKLMAVRIWAGAIPEAIPGYLGGGIMPLF